MSDSGSGASMASTSGNTPEATLATPTSSLPDCEDTMPPGAVSPPKDFGSLPPEMREMVYQRVYADTRDIVILVPGGHAEDVPYIRQRYDDVAIDEGEYPNLAYYTRYPDFTIFENWQEEAFEAYIKYNTFTFLSVADFAKFITNQDSEGTIKKQIRSIKFLREEPQHLQPGSPNLAELIKNCPLLKRLEVAIDMQDYHLAQQDRHRGPMQQSSAEAKEARAYAERWDEVIAGIKEVKDLKEFVLSDSEWESYVSPTGQQPSGLRRPSNRELTRMRLEEEIRKEVLSNVSSVECDGTG